MGMCTEEATRKIVEELLQKSVEKNKISLFGKTIVLLLITAFGSAIGFNTTTLWAMQESIHESQAVFHKTMLNMVAKNTALIAEIESWRILHENTKDAAIREFRMMIQHNAGDIKDIVTNKADDRWRLSDEINDNEKKDLFHASLVKEDKYLREAIGRNYADVNTDIKQLQVEINDIEDELQTQHDQYLNLKRESKSVRE